MSSEIELVRAERDRRDQLNAVRSERQRRGNIVSAVVEPARAIASGAARSVVGGYAGMADQMRGNDGGKTVERIRSGGYQPQTETGQRSLQRVGDLVEMGVDILNFPLSGLYGLGQLFTTGDPGAAADKVRQVQDLGVSKTLGNDVFEATGSPVLAAGAETAPEAVASVFGLKGGQSAIRRAPQAAQETKRLAAPVTEIFTRQSPAKQRIAKLIQEGSDDIDTALFKIDETRLLPVPSRENMPVPRVIADQAAKSAVDAGFDKGVVATIKATADKSKAKMRQMVDRMERGMKNKRYAVLNRPGDVVGDSLLDRVKAVRKANRDAGVKLNQVAQSLRGKEVDASSAVNSFLDDMDSLGVRLNDDLTLNFDGSIVGELDAPRKALERVVRWMTKTDTPPTAYDLHQTKKYIDELVTYGKQGEGLSGRVENILKSLRHNIDETLDGQFPEYNAVNTQYAETIGALDSLQEVAGKKLNLSGGNADKALGTLLRRVMSNAQSRVPLIDAIADLEGMAQKYGSKFDDDLIAQVLFADELDAVFKPVARTSFEGLIDRSVGRRVPRSKSDLVDRAAEMAEEVFFGDQEERAFAAIRSLLDQ